MAATWKKTSEAALRAAAYSTSDIPDEAAGLVTPMEVLTISDFTHETIDTSTAESKAAAN